MLTRCEPNEWTDLGNAGETIIETRGIGCYICLTADKTANPAEVTSMASDSKIVLSGPASVYPAQSVKAVNIYHNGV